MKIVNVSMNKQNLDRLKTLSKNSKLSNFGSLIGNIHKIKLDEPQLSSRCKKVKRVYKQNTLSSDSNIQKGSTIYNSNTSQDLEYNKTVKVMKKNKSG